MFGLNPYAILGGLVALIAAAGLGFAEGRHLKTIEVAAAQVQQLNRTVVVAGQQAKATGKVDRSTAAATAAISATTAALQQKVPIYVTRASDDQCVVGVGAVRLLDDAATGPAVPAAPGDGLPAADPGLADAQADSGVRLSDIVSADIANAGSYQTLAARLKAWDDWYDAQAAIAAGGKPHAATGPDGS